MRDGIEELRNPMDVIKQLADKWGSLSSMQTAPIIDALGGKYRGNQLVALVENFDMYEKMLSTYAGSAGSAMKENEIRMNSLQVKINQLQNAVSEFWNSAIDTGMIKGFVDIATGLVSTFGNLHTIIVDVLAVLLLWKGASIINFFAAFGNETGRMTLGITKYGQELMKAKLLAQGFTEAEIAAKVATMGFGASLKAVFTTNPLGWAMLAISAIVGIVDVVNQSKEAMKQAINTSAETAKTESDNLTSLLSKYQELNAIVDKDDTAKQQLKLTQDELIKSLGLEKEAIDLVNDSRGESIKKVAEESLAKLKADQSTLQAKVNQANKDASARPFLGVRNEVGGHFDGATTYASTVNDILQKLKIVNSEAQKQFAGIFVNLDKTKNTQELYDKLNSLIELTDEYGNNTTAQYTKMVSVRDKYAILLEAENSALNDLNKNQAIQGALFTQMTVGTPTKDNFQQFKDGAVDAIAKQQNLNDVSVDFKKIIYDQIDTMYPQLSGVIKDATTATNAQTTALASTAEILYKFPADLKAVEDAFTATADSIKLLASAQDDLKNSHEISSDTLQSLIEKYPQLITYLGNEVEMSKQISGILEIEKENQRLNFEAKLTYNVDYFNKVIKGNVDTWNIVKDTYGVDAANFKTVADAKLKTNDLLVSMIGASWSTLYSSQEDALQSIINSITNKLYGQDTNSGLPQVFAKQLTDAKAQLAALKAMSAPMKIASQKIPFVSIPKSKSSSSPSSSSSSTPPSPTSYDLNLDPYEKFNTLLAEINNELELNNSLQDSASESDKIKLLEQRNSLLAKQQTILAQLNTAQKTERDQLASRLIHSEGIYIDASGNLINASDVLQRRVNSANALPEGDWKKANLDNIKEIEDAVNRYRELVSSEIPKTYQDWIDSANAISKNVIAIKDLANQLETDALSKMKDLRKQQYEEEKTAFDDLIDHKIKRLDDLQAKEDYDKNINKQDIAIAKKQSEINALYGDDSVAGMNKKAEFEAQLLDLKTARQDTANQHNIDAQKIALQKQKDNSDAAFDEKLKDANLQAQVEIDLATKAVDELKTMYGTLWDSFNDSISKLGQSLKTEFIDRLIEAKNIINAPITTSSSSAPSLPSTPPPYVAPIPQSVLAPSSAPNSYVVVKGDTLWDIAKRYLGNALRYPELAKLNNIKNPNLIYPGQVIRFNSGGYSGNSEGLGYIDKKEIILNSIDTTNLLKAVDITRSIVSNLNIGKTPNLTNNTKQGDIILNQTNNITASSGMSEEGIAKMVWKYTANELSKIGR